MKLSILKHLLFIGSFAVFAIDSLAQDIKAAPAQAKTDHSIQLTADYFYATSDAILPEDPTLNITGDDDTETDLAGFTLSYGSSLEKGFELRFSYKTGSSEFDWEERFLDPSLAGVVVANEQDSDENWYEAQFILPLRIFDDPRLIAFLSSGITFIESDNTTRSTVRIPGLADAQGRSIDGDAWNFFGNLGAGISRTRQVTEGGARLSVNLEANVLFGTQETENIRYDILNNGALLSVDSTDESIFGFIGRGSLQLNVPLGDRQAEVIGSFTLKTGLRYYHWDTDAGSQSVWGPFVNAGFRVSF